MFISILFFGFIKCMDVRLSLGTDLGNGTYPVVITLREPLIYEINNIDLFLVYDISGSMYGPKETNLKKALNLVIDALESKDRLTLIPFQSYAETVFDLQYMTSSNKQKAKNIVTNTVIGGNTVFTYAITKLVEGIQKAYKNKKDRVKSVIFLTDGIAEDNLKGILKNALGTEIDKYDFTVNTFGFSSDAAAANLASFADSRDGAFYAIGNNELNKIQDYVLNTIGAMRTSSYKFVNVDIRSNFDIVKFYGSSHLSQGTAIAPTDKRKMTCGIYQFITGKDYSYVLLVKIPKNINIGQRILTVYVDFTDFSQKHYSTYNYLLFYQAVGCFNCYKEEYCRVLVMDLIDRNILSSSASSSFQTEVNNIRSLCGEDLNHNISVALNTINDHLKNNNRTIINYMYGVLSEGFLKRNGMNVWYSNEYQYDLINNYLYKDRKRHIWERFHFPYWKIGFLNYIHRLTAVPLQFIFILLITTLCIPFSLISNYLFRGGGRLIFNMITGLGIQIILFDLAFLNVFIACSAVYFSLRYTKIHGGPILFTLFGYLMLVHLFHFYYYGQTLDFGASSFLFMFAIAKITFFTYAVRERKVNPAKFVNQYHRYCITDEEFPNYVEFLSYIYFFPSAIYGPCFQIRDYLNYVYNKEEYVRMNKKKEIQKGFIRIVIGYGLIFTFYFLKYNTYLQWGIFKIYEYLASDDVLAMNVVVRFLLIYFYSIFIKLFIYGFFQLIYGIFVTTGVAYSEEVVLPNLKGGPDFVLDLSDKKGHCGDIMKSDLGYNIGDAINNFNRSIHIYLKYCVYIRIIFLRNSWIKNYFIAAIFVFIFAALWCGIYIGMYFFFAAACIMYQLHFNLELFGFYDWLDTSHIAVKIVFTIITQYLLSMIFNMLFLYKIQMTWCYLRNFYYMPFLIIVILYLISLAIRLIGFRKEKGEEKKGNRSKTKKRDAKKEELVYTNKYTIN